MIVVAWCEIKRILCAVCSTPYCEVVGNPNSFVEYDLPTQETLLDNNTHFFPGRTVIIFQHKMQVVICIISSQLFNLNTSAHALQRPWWSPWNPQHAITIAALNLYQGLCIIKARITARGFAFIQECSRRWDGKVKCERFALTQLLLMWCNWDP